MTENLKNTKNHYTSSMQFEVAQILHNCQLKFYAIFTFGGKRIPENTYEVSPWKFQNLHVQELGVFCVSPRVHTVQVV